MGVKKRLRLLISSYCLLGSVFFLLHFKFLTNSIYPKTLLSILLGVSWYSQQKTLNVVCLGFPCLWRPNKVYIYERREQKLFHKQAKPK